MPKLTRVSNGVHRHHRPVHDARPNREPDETPVAGRISCGKQQEHAERRVDPPNHLEVGRLLGRPCPPTRPNAVEQGDAEDKDEAEYSKYRPQEGGRGGAVHTSPLVKSSIARMSSSGASSARK